MKYIIKPDLNLIFGGDMPNIQMPTMGGKVFWDTKRHKNGYKLQVNYFTGHARILNEDDERIAWGDEAVMAAKFEMLTREEQLMAGDVIGISRGIYEHYAVYIGNDEIIHYAAVDGDFNGTIKVHKSTMEKFLDGSGKFFVLVFPEKYDKPVKMRVETKGMVGLPFDIAGDIAHAVKSLQYHLYTPEETVERAYSRLGETKYNLVTNNCEHFAVWCKTGISESHQVNSILKMAKGASRSVMALR